MRLIVLDQHYLTVPFLSGRLWFLLAVLASLFWALGVPAAEYIHRVVLNFIDGFKPYPPPLQGGRGGWRWSGLSSRRSP